MGDVFLDAFLDTLKILPFLLAINFLIEFVEYKSKGLKADKILKGAAAPLLATAAGIVPQCGFSVVATELYSKRRIAMSALIAVYIATSDEALPIMLSSREGLIKLWPILIIKVCFAIIVGYAVFGAEKLSKRVRARASNTDDTAPKSAAEKDRAPQADQSGDNAGDKARAADSANVCSTPPNAQLYVHVHDGHAADEHFHTHAHAYAHDGHAADDEHDEHDHGEHEEHADDEHEKSGRVRGCHHHELTCAKPAADATKKQKAAYVWSVYLKHPLIHTATVLLYIFIVNVIFGIVVYYIGEERLAAFMSRTGYFQPLFAGIIGLIPNCAASVVITEMYVIGGLGLGGAVSGLCCSAGIGYAVLVKQNRPLKNSIAVIAISFCVSVVLGICITACGF